MDPNTLLQQLAPLRAPAPISWWPPAPGWWLVAILLLAALLAAGWWLAVRRRRNAYRRLALKTLAVQQQAGSISVADLNILLKATALRGWPATDVASLHGEAWEQFLCSSAPKLSGASFDGLADLYRNPDAAASDELIKAASQWIRKHSVDANRQEAVDRV